MRCHKCNQDSITIKDGHILCDICGLDIDVSFILEDGLFDLFFYNKNLEEAEKLGQESMIGGKELTDNPYSITADQIILNKRWELGYTREKESYEFNALSLSAEKIEGQLRTEIIELFKQKERLLSQKERLDIDIEKLNEYIKLLSKKKYILGSSYRKDIINITEFIHLRSKGYNI